MFNTEGPRPAEKTVPHCPALIASGPRRGQTCGAHVHPGARICRRHKAQAALLPPLPGETDASSVPTEIVARICAEVARLRPVGKAYMSFLRLRRVSKAFREAATDSMVTHLSAHVPLYIARVSGRLTPMQRLDLAFGKGCQCCGREDGAVLYPTLLSRLCDGCFAENTLVKGDLPYSVQRSLEEVPWVWQGSDRRVLVRQAEAILQCSVSNSSMIDTARRLEGPDGARHAGLRSKIVELSGLAFDARIPLDRQARLVHSATYRRPPEDVEPSQLVERVMKELWRHDFEERLSELVDAATIEELGGPTLVDHFAEIRGARFKCSHFARWAAKKTLFAASAPDPSTCPLQAAAVAALGARAVLEARLQHDERVHEDRLRLLQTAVSWLTSRTGHPFGQDIAEIQFSPFFLVEALARPETPFMRWVAAAVPQVAREDFEAPEEWLRGPCQDALRRSSRGYLRRIVREEFFDVLVDYTNALSRELPTRKMREEAVGLILRDIFFILPDLPRARLGPDTRIPIRKLAMSEFERLQSVQSVRDQMDRRAAGLHRLMVGCSPAELIEHYTGEAFLGEAMARLFGNVPAVPCDPKGMFAWFPSVALPRLEAAFHSVPREAGSLVRCPLCGYHGTFRGLQDHATAKHAQAVECVGRFWEAHWIPFARQTPA